MTLDFTSAASFWLLALVPAVWAAGGFRRSGAGARHKRGEVALTPREIWVPIAR